MGEYADMMINGHCCQECGEFFHDDEAAGYPRSCAGCGGGPSQASASRRPEGKRRREKARRARKVQARRDILKAADPTGWNQHTEYHWSKTVCGLRMDFWPSGKKAMFNGEVYSGVEDIERLCEVLKGSIGACDDT